ncbi:glycosyltransferase family 39 protein [Arthrobacter sp. SLBN-112]|uniref:glycosyltransferase family 39 protein n=1 Tax=Arthrobacter sp. SLBN-112 TaxID=2768452 RepID=UPI0027B2086F|nr:glycosyltransferase family 39 protein [Arthrobacter sp. SLBN-112]MDQ0800406.1 4-amino-4-deoxy-L-arabinose transferase-like glycosyltransferase [Arthrobacter sp. SLBN-112]
MTNAATQRSVADSLSTAGPGTKDDSAERSGHRETWERTALWSLLAVSAVLYLFGLDRNGWANSYYSAAVMSGAQDWTAFLFGSSDAANAITVDKPPLSLWIMSLSARLFGLSSWSILVPQALMGVASVYLLFRMVRTYTDARTGLLAGAFLAVTPVATLMFRYNNPDALLCLLMIGIAWSTLESIRRSKLRWLMLTGALIGAALLTKQLQVGLILPAVTLAYLAYASGALWRRLAHLVLAAATSLVSGGWWFLLVQLTDPSERPFVGGTRLNNVVELTFGYNGLDRLTGADASRTMSPNTQALAEQLDGGFQRFLQPQFSGQFGWFLPFALTGFGIAIYSIWKRREDRSKLAYLLFMALWFACSATVLAFMSGIVHPYYSLGVVPSLCALAAVGFMKLAAWRTGWKPRMLLAATLLSTMVLVFATASRSAADFPGLPPIFLGLWAIVAALQLVPGRNPFQAVSSALLLFALMLGPVIWSVNTILSPHVGAGVVAGPSLLGIRTDHPDRQQLGPSVPPSFIAVMFGDIPNASVLRRLENAGTTTTWATATVGSESAANYQLQLGRPVLPIGGFDGTDPFPSLEQFTAMVANKRVGSLTIQNLPPLTLEGRGESARIVDWVRANFPKETLDGAEFYDLSK